MTAQCADTNSCIEVNDLKVHFMLKSGLFPKPKILKAVDGVFLPIGKGRTMGLVEESGCGRATVGRTILKLYQAIVSRVLHQGTDIAGLSDSQMTPYRKKIQMIFQDPCTSLDLRKNIGDITAEPIWAVKLHTRKDRNDRVGKLIGMAGLRSNHINRCPRKFSGGRGRRIGIARVLVAELEFIVCDESISALGVSIQAQVTDILGEPQDKFHFMYLFVSHNLSVVRHISSEIGVIYLGNLIEYAQVDELYNSIFRPYTQSLISTVSAADPKLAKENKRIILERDTSSPINPAPGCPFRSRRRYAKDICSQVKLELRTVSGKHKVACHPSDWANGAKLTQAEAWGQKHEARSM